MNNITLINCIVFLLIHEVQCEVVLFAVKEEFNNSAQVTFSCYSSIGSLDCSAEFLYNIQTLDTLRSSRGKCYHKQQLCSREKCSCSKECNTFILIITNHKYKNGDIIGCEVQHMNNGHILSTTAEIIYNGSVFRFHKTHVSTVAKPDRYSSTSPTEQHDVIESNTGEETVIVVVHVIVIAIVLVTIGCCWIRRMTNQGRCANAPKGGRRKIISGRRLMDIRAARRENISNRRQNEFSFERLVDIPQNEILLDSQEHLDINRPRPIQTISTQEFEINFTRTRSASFTASPTEFEINFTRTRPASFTASSTDAKRYIQKTRPASFSAMSAEDSARNSNRSTPVFNNLMPNIFTTDIFNSTTSISSGVPLMDEVTHL